MRAWNSTTIHPVKIVNSGISLVVQWLRITRHCRGKWVWALVREDPTCCGATKPVHHNYWAHTPQLLKPMHLEPVLRNKRSHCTTIKSRPHLLQLKKAHTQQRRPNTDQKKKKKGTSLVVQWVRPYTSTAGGVGLILGRGTKIPHAPWPKKNKKTMHSWRAGGK